MRASKTEVKTELQAALSEISKLRTDLGKERRLYADAHEQVETFKQQLYDSNRVQTQLKEELGRAHYQLRDTTEPPLGAWNGHISLTLLDKDFRK